MESNRRTFERIATKIPAEVFEAKSPKKIGKANIFNISFGGVGLEAGFMVNEGEKLIVKFHLKMHKYDFSRLILEGEVEVRWASLSGDKRFYGVKFEKISVENRRRIKKYLESVKEKRKRGAENEEK